MNHKYKVYLLGTQKPIELMANRIGYEDCFVVFRKWIPLDDPTKASFSTVAVFAKSVILRIKMVQEEKNGKA